MNRVKTEVSLQDWDFFWENGYLKLGKCMDAQQLSALRNRIDAIMLGDAEIDYDRLMMQREAGEGLMQSGQTYGFKGASLNYRKIENLEHDDLFRAYMELPIFEAWCRKIYDNQPVACYRAMFMNKPAYNGSKLGFHQDRWRDLDRDPQLTIWTALDPATRANGCVHVYPGTHRSLLNPDNPSGFLAPEHLEQVAADHPLVPLELEAGEAVLLHNWTVHGSEGNHTAQSRRAFSVCYLDGRTVSASGREMTPLFSQ